MIKNKKTSRRKGFTLVELMLVVAILSLLATLAIPNYLRARKRSQAATLMDDLRAVDNAMELYAVEFNRAGNDTIGTSDLVFMRRYLKDRIRLYESLPNDMFGNTFTVSDLQTPPRVSMATYEALSDVAPLEFWAPYTPTP